ncbi:MAG: PEP-CTERM sorting domain-containing protein [Planctomycetales bacterium]|nr:PEP-CTERM sorting domain-containing protein [Planctomycetales bacterium]
MRSFRKVFLCAFVCLWGLNAPVDGAVISDFNNFAESGNMLNSASHNREQNFATSGTTITITEASRSVGSAGQELWGSSEFASFTTEGYRLQVEFNLADIVRSQTNARVGLMTSSALPAGGPTSGDVRNSTDYLYWTIQGGSVRFGGFPNGGAEVESNLFGIGSSGTDVSGLYMARTATGWDLGYLDLAGNDVLAYEYVPGTTVGGKLATINPDGTFVGLYSDMRVSTDSYGLSNLSYGLVTAIPEPSSAFACCILGAFAITRRRRKLTKN